MRAFVFDSTTLAGPAAARKTTFIRRALHNAVCAIGLSLIAGSLIPLLVNYPLLLAMLALDVEAGQRFLKATPERKSAAAAGFMAMSVVAISTYAAMALVGALLGGAEGRLAAMFLAAGSLVTIIVLMVEAPLYMVLSAAPCALLLAVLPLLPSAQAVHAPGSTIGLYLTFAVFAHQLYRTADHHVRLHARNRASREEVDRRREEAEARRQEAECRRQEAEKASRVKSEFLTTMTHELRTPLNAVINYAEIIEEDAVDGVADDARRIRRSARHLLGLIDRILDFSALQEGKISLALTKFDLVELARSTLVRQREIMRMHNNSEEVVCEDVFAPVLADRERVEQCLEVLLSNAARFTADGHVKVVVERHGPDWCVSVSDTGAGMSPEQMEQAFQPFAQASDVLTRRADGLGLGLASARMIARLMEGDIVGESMPGTGSRFSLTLPARTLGLRAA